MRDLQEAIEVGCRAIEAYMKDRGEQMSFHPNEINMSRDVLDAGVTKIDISIQGVHQGSTDKRKNEERTGLKARLTKSGKAAQPSVVADIPDAGYRAGARALLEKFQKGIANATEIAEGASVPPHLRRMITQAGTVRPDDNVAKLLDAVIELADERNSARETAASAERRAQEILDANPEIQLQKRLKLKLKAQYTEQRDVLVDFQRFLLDNYSSHFPECRPNAVDEFLEDVELDDV